MKHMGRALFLALLLTAVVVAWVRLGRQGVPFGDVAVTGLVFVAGLAGFFGLLLGVGALLKRFTSGDDD